jgi:hypothetical protein
MLTLRRLENSIVTVDMVVDVVAAGEAQADEDVVEDAVIVASVVIVAGPLLAARDPRVEMLRTARMVKVLTLPLRMVSRLARLDLLWFLPCAHIHVLSEKDNRR